MRITPQNKTEVNALEWAIQGLAASGWDSAEEVAHACDIDDPELHETAVTCQGHEGPLRPPLGLRLLQRPRGRNRSGG
jgi:hypothetical protein